MNGQGELELQLKRPFAPQSSRVGPRVWIAEVRIYRRFAPDALQRKYELHPGLNILWADPGAGKTKLYERGISGHAAGKTTFCRFLRYLVGEPSYGTTVFQQAIVDWEPDALLVGKVVLDNESWIVCRPLGLDRRDFAFKGTNFDEMFTMPSTALKYSEFAEKLGDAVISPLTARSLPYGFPLTWRYVLPWLSRDQECRLANLLEWRDSATEAHRPDMTAADACYIIRSVMGLITKDEEDAQKLHRKLLQDRKDLEATLPLSKHDAAQGLRLVRGWASDAALEGDLLFDNVRRELGRALARPEKTEELAAAKRFWEERQEAVASLERQVGAAESELKKQEALLAADRRTVGALHNDAARAEMEAEAPAALDRCNVLLRVARAKGCKLARGRTLDIESHRNMVSGQTDVEDEKAVLAQAEAAVAGMRDQLAQLRQVLLGARAESVTAFDKYQALQAEVERHKETIAQRLRDLKDVEAKCTKAEADSTRLDNLRKDVEASQRKQEDIRQRADENRTRVNELFEDIVQAVMGDDVTAQFVAHSQSIDLKVSCNGERRSAATDTVKMLAFDIAAMLLSAEGFGHHPRFLIHDSPREADMSNDIYQRFFLYMAEIQKTFGGGTPNYQYILTTTEPPPEHLRQKPWLTAKLDASVPEGRILGANL